MRAETLIGQALRFDVAAHAAHVAASARPDRGSHWVALTAGLAASLLAVLTVFGLSVSRSELEPAELATDDVYAFSYAPDPADPAARTVHRFERVSENELDYYASYARQRPQGPFPLERQ